MEMDFLLERTQCSRFRREAETLIKYLNEETEELEVISIIGMPVLGKTTLAWKIYRDPRIQHEFPTLIWVCISQDLSRRHVFLTILKKFTQQDMSSKTDDELAQLVRSYLEKRKFLLFMDDWWTADSWKYIEVALPKSNRSGKVLITSLYEKVAWQANPKREPHRLRFLDSKESWELLQLEVFGKLDECPPELKKPGKDIANQCGGVPLAIIVVGGILVEKFLPIGGNRGMENEWENVLARLNTYLKDDREKTKLPHDLRVCFLYLGVFPEDYEILAWKLIRLWNAEGFIQQNPEKSLEKVAEDNLKDLINRN
ncbi:hypothetical protein Pfo_020333 [Paulownia fortunei]|nr:hypothetical protein Pfo_020333 [Paulownia fortunei]